MVKMDESGDENEEMQDNNEEQEVSQDVYMPGDPMDDGEELTFDKSAYELYHAAQTGSPCLSFDIVQDGMGDNRTQYPMACYVVCGTQAEGRPNQLILMKMSELSKMNDDSDSEDSYIEDEADGPVLHTYSTKHVGGVNRIRYCNSGQTHLAATWADTGKVHIWDLSKDFEKLNMSGVAQHQQAPNKTNPLFTFGGHQAEGFAIDWSPVTFGRLATGSCNRNIHLWQPREDGSWHVDQRPLTSHTDSVEDLQWSPNEENVLASCSVDKTIRIWDARAQGNKSCMLTVEAHDADVNVISWNRNEPFILSGGDDGVLKVWDLRQLGNGVPVAIFKHHSGPITSVEWHSKESSIFAASGEDNQITLWDLAVEKDDEQENLTSINGSAIPPQLLFIHMGQTDIKELHWHKQLPGVILSTAESGFNIFKTISV